MMDDPKTHESYGLISLGRVTSQPAQVLFGSSIRHGETIRLRISRARMYRELSRDWYHEEGMIVEVDLSPSQFTDFVTTHNRGSGVPCTIRYVGGTPMADPPFEDKREQFRNEFKDHARNVARKLDAVRQFANILAEKPTVTKAERARLVELIGMAYQEVQSNIPFLASQFDEQMDKSVTEAKGEIEGFAMRRLLQAGARALETDGAPEAPIPQLGLETKGESDA